MLSFILSKTTCLPSDHSVLAVQMKTWEPFMLPWTRCLDSYVQDKILIIKFLPIDGLATSTIMACEVATLTHKSWNYSVKSGTFITNTQSKKVFCCLWKFVCKQLQSVNIALRIGWAITSWFPGPLPLRRHHLRACHWWQWVDHGWLAWEALGQQHLSVLSGSLLKATGLSFIQGVLGLCTGSSLRADWRAMTLCFYDSG